jgi:Uma2 family endonuclease
MREHRRPRRRMTLEQYLAFEERSPIRHEYVAGEVYAMSGPTTRHNTISLNIHRHLHAYARARGCRVFVEAIKVAVLDRVYYPDVIVACGKAAEVELIVDAPSVVVEVTSPSTRATDRREKLDAYMHIPSLQAYLIVEQRREQVIVYTRSYTGEWQRDQLDGDGEVPIEFLDCRLSLAQIYEDVSLPPLKVREQLRAGRRAGNG